MEYYINIDKKEGFVVRGKKIKIVVIVSVFFVCLAISVAYAYYTIFASYVPYDEERFVLIFIFTTIKRGFISLSLSIVETKYCLCNIIMLTVPH